MAGTTHFTRPLPSFWAALRHHTFLTLACAVAVAGLAGAYVATSSSTYVSTAVVMLNPLSGSPLSPDSARGSSNQVIVAMQTEAQLAQTPSVTELVSEELGRIVPDDGEQLTVQGPDGTQMLRVSFTSHSPALARDGAQAFAEGILAHREETAAASLEARLAALEDQAMSVDEALQQATSRANSAPTDTYAQEQVQLHADRLAQLDASISETRVEDTNAGRVLTPAEAPDSPAGPSSALILAGAIFAGFGIGVCFALYREWRRGLVRDEESIQLTSGLAVFAQVPKHRHQAMAHLSADTALHESYRRLRAGVVTNAKRPHILAVAAIGEHSASTVTANLAVALSDADFSVLVVAANPHGGEIETLLDVSPSPGLSEVVLDQLAPKGALQRTGGVTVLAGGLKPERARELYAGPALGGIVQSLNMEFDYVLIDAAGTGTSDGDAAIAAAHSALLVVINGHTTHAQISAALDRFARLNISTIGAVGIRVGDAGHRAQETAPQPRRDQESPRESSPRGTDAALT